MMIRSCTLYEIMNRTCVGKLPGTHDDHVKGHVLQPFQPPVVWGDADGSHFFGWDTVIADDLVVLIDHSLADIDADDQLGVLCRQHAGDETCVVSSRMGHRLLRIMAGARSDTSWNARWLTCSTRKIHDGRDALFEQPSVLHGLSDFLGASLCVLAIVVLVRCCVKVVLVRCFVVGAIEQWVRMWGVRVVGVCVKILILRRL